MVVNQPREQEEEHTTNSVVVVAICILFIVIFGFAIWMQYQRYKVIKTALKTGHSGVAAEIVAASALSSVAMGNPYM